MTEVELRKRGPWETMAKLLEKAIELQDDDWEKHMTILEVARAQAEYYSKFHEESA